MSVEFREGPGGHSFRVKGENGEIVAHGEGYTRAHDAKRGYATLVRLIADDIRKHMMDTSSDAAIAIGEDAFKAGWSACVNAVQGGLNVSFPNDSVTQLEQAWSDFEPSEDVKGLEISSLEGALAAYLAAEAVASA